MNTSGWIAFKASVEDDRVRLFILQVLDQTDRSVGSGDIRSRPLSGHLKDDLHQNLGLSKTCPASYLLWILSAIQK